MVVQYENSWGKWNSSRLTAFDSFGDWRLISLGKFLEQTWGELMGSWGLKLRAFWFVAAEFAVAAAFIVSVAAIAKYGL